MLGRIEGGRTKERLNVRGNDSIKETLGRSVQELRGLMRTSLIRWLGVRADSKASNTGYPMLRQEWDRAPWSSRGWGALTQGGSGGQAKLSAEVPFRRKET